MNTCLVEFEDGYQVTTSRNYLIKPATLQRRMAKRASEKGGQAKDTQSER